ARPPRHALPRHEPRRPYRTRRRARGRHKRRRHARRDPPPTARSPPERGGARTARAHYPRAATLPDRRSRRRILGSEEKARSYGERRPSIHIGLVAPSRREKDDLST